MWISRLQAKKSASGNHKTGAFRESLFSNQVISDGILRDSICISDVTIPWHPAGVTFKTPTQPPSSVAAASHAISDPVPYSDLAPIEKEEDYVPVQEEDEMEESDRPNNSGGVIHNLETQSFEDEIPYSYTPTHSPPQSLARQPRRVDEKKQPSTEALMPHFNDKDILRFPPICVVPDTCFLFNLVKSPEEFDKFICDITLHELEIVVPKVVMAEIQRIASLKNHKAHDIGRNIYDWLSRNQSNFGIQRRIESRSVSRDHAPSASHQSNDSKILTYALDFQEQLFNIAVENDLPAHFASSVLLITDDRNLAGKASFKVPVANSETWRRVIKRQMKKTSSVNNRPNLSSTPPPHVIVVPCLESLISLSRGGGLWDLGKTKQSAQNISLEVVIPPSVFDEIDERKSTYLDDPSLPMDHNSEPVIIKKINSWASDLRNRNLEALANQGCEPVVNSRMYTIANETTNAQLLQNRDAFSDDMFSDLQIAIYAKALLDAAQSVGSVGDDGSRSTHLVILSDRPSLDEEALNIGLNTVTSAHWHDGVQTLANLLLGPTPKKSTNTDERQKKSSIGNKSKAAPISQAEVSPQPPQPNQKGPADNLASQNQYVYDMNTVSNFYDSTLTNAIPIPNVDPLPTSTAHASSDMAPDAPAASQQASINTCKCPFRKNGLHKVSCPLKNAA